MMPPEHGRRMVRSALDAATLARCGYIPCFCPDDWRADTPEASARCPQHGTDAARAGWFDSQRERTEAIIRTYLDAASADHA